MKSLFEPKARNNNPVTSVEAAESVYRPSMTAVAIFSLLLKGKMTDDELVAAYQQKAEAGVFRLASDQSIRSRRSELVRGGFVEFAGVYGVTKFGRRAQVWRAVKGVSLAVVRGAMKGETK